MRLRDATVLGKVLAIGAVAAFAALQLWALLTDRFGWLVAFVVLDVVVLLFRKPRTPGRHPHSLDP